MKKNFMLFNSRIEIIRELLQKFYLSGWNSSCEQSSFHHLLIFEVLPQFSNVWNRLNLIKLTMILYFNCNRCTWNNAIQIFWTYVGSNDKNFYYKHIIFYFSKVWNRPNLIEFTMILYFNCNRCTWNIAIQIFWTYVGSND